MSSILGRPLFMDHSLLFFPGYDNQYMFLDGAERFAARLAELPHARPPQKANYKPLTAQPTIKTGGSETAAKVKPNVLIGTADDGLYLRQSDIERLGLEYTGRQVMTRQGMSKVWSGNVTLRFPYDYNGGAVKYQIQHVLELPDFVTKTVIADETLNTKKEGILGTRRITRHLVFFHKGDVHLIDIAVVPQLADCFEGGKGLTPIGSVMPVSRYETETVENSSREDEPVRDLEYILRVAVYTGQLPPFNAFTDIPRDIQPAFSLMEKCRTCGREESPNDGVHLLKCSKCCQEKRAPRALYCCRACQAFDWHSQHKQEHRGTIPWSVETVHRTPRRSEANAAITQSSKDD